MPPTLLRFRKNYMHFFEILYYLGLSAKKYYSLRHQIRLPSRVISIGNLTTGGTGKTPAVITVAEEAKKRGLKPVVLSRGYRGRVKGPCFVTKGDLPLLTPEEAGDEPYLMAGRLRDVPIVIGASRYDAGMFAVRELLTDRPFPAEHMLFILDDGFQHWGLYRDKDILLIDSGNPFGNGMMLPFGRLREPLQAIERADVIVLTKRSANEGQNNSADDIIRKIKQYNTDAPVFYAEHKAAACRFLSGDSQPMQWLSGKKLFGFCALGSPESFRKTILSSGADLAGFRTFRDHYRYTSDDIARVKAEAIESGAEWIATTEKDIIKITNLDLPDNILIIDIEFSVSNGFHDEIFKVYHQ